MTLADRTLSTVDVHDCFSGLRTFQTSGRLSSLARAESFLPFSLLKRQVFNFVGFVALLCLQRHPKLICRAPGSCLPHYSTSTSRRNSDSASCVPFLPSLCRPSSYRVRNGTDHLLRIVPPSVRVLPSMLGSALSAVLRRAGVQRRWIGLAGCAGSSSRLLVSNRASGADSLLGDGEQANTFVAKLPGPLPFSVPFPRGADETPLN